MIDLLKYKDVIDFPNPYMMEYPPGWEDIVIDLLDKILEKNLECQILQIKEKFGQLRVYYASSHYDEIKELVKNAELLCDSTCQISGDKGALRNIGGWLIVLSDEEYEKRNTK